jgi:HEAT repeat protein
VGQLVLVLWQNLGAPITALLIWGIIEIISSTAKDTPLWLARQVFGSIRRMWKELVHLRSFLHSERYVQWRPQTQRYVALCAVKAQVSEDHDNEQSPDRVPCPLIDLLQECLKNCKSVLVLGAPGAGKTTAFEALTYRLARTAYRRSLLAWFFWLMGAALLVLWSPLIALLWLAVLPLPLSRVRLWVTPFFLELRAFFGQNARDFLTQAVKVALGDAVLLDAKGRCLFLLDGTNEIHRDRAACFLETWHTQRSTPLAFFSSRSGEKPALEAQTTLEICELDDDGVKDYFRVYLKDKVRRQPDDSAVDVEAEMAEWQHTGLLAQGGIGRNPYWLQMLVLSRLQTRNRGALFLSFARELIRREIEVKPGERKRKPEWKTVPLGVEMDALAGLALAINQEHQVGLEGEEGWKRGREAIRTALGDDRSETPDDVLGEAEAATLIRQRYKERIEFSHQLVQEFFAAYALRSSEHWNKAISCCEDPWWWETLFLLGGLTAIPEANGSPENWIAFTLSILGDCENDPRLFVAIGLLCSVESSDSDVTSKVMEAFIRHVAIPLTENQQRAVQELGRIIGDETIRVFDALLDEADHQAKVKSAAMLCALNSQRAIEVLLTKLRRQYMDTLIPIGAPAVEPLTKALRTDDQDARQEAAMALGEIGDARAVPPLIVVLKDDDYSVRRKAAAALGKLGDARAVEPLIAALKDDAWQVREGAAAALGELGDARAVEPLIAVLKDHRKWVQRGATDALVKLGSVAVKPLIAALRDRDPGVRSGVANALEGLRDTAVASLIAVLKDDDWQMRQGASTTLGKLGDVAVEPLIATLKDDDYSVRWRTAVALGKLGDRRAVGPLIAALKDDNCSVQCSAAEALGELGDEHAAEPLIAVLKNRDRWVQQRTADALGKLGAKQATEPLITMLKDREPRKRQSAAAALGKLGNVQAVEPLIAALRDSDRWVQRDAAAALGKLGDVRAVESLVATLGSRDRWVRGSAAEALKTITRRHFGQDVDAWLVWWQEQQ